MRSRDTTDAAHEAQLRCYRAMSGAARVALAAQLSEDIRAVAMAGIRARHPEYSDRDAWHALRQLLLGDELFFQGAAARPTNGAVSAGNFLARLAALLQARIQRSRVRYSR
jgi:hypothetical protein